MKKFLLLFCTFLFIVVVWPASVSACDYSKGKITSITPATAVSIGGSLIINGSGFGDRNLVNDQYDREVIVSYRKNNQKWSGGVFGRYGIISWSDTKIEIVIPPGYESGFYSSDNSNDVGLFDPSTDRMIPEIYIHPGSTDSKWYTLCADPLNSVSFLYNSSCNADVWSCDDWSECSLESQQTRHCSKTFDCRFANTPSPTTSQSCVLPVCTANSYSCGNWSSCSIDGRQSRTCSRTTNCLNGIPLPAISQSCTYIPPVCTSWTYSNWSDCSSSGIQTRSINSSSPNSCEGGNPVLSQSCVPTCVANDWPCSDWSSCSSGGKQTRICNKTSNCQGGVSAPATSQSCAYVPTCTSYSWSCGDWGTCAPNGTKNRTCNKVSNCEGGVQSPVTSQSCIYTPPCNADTWTCGDWSICSSSGTQTRSCYKSYDCSTAETPPPATSQYCQAPYQPPAPSTPPANNTNQDSIIKATVKLECPLINKQGWKNIGSGTIIAPNGKILTNRHVIEGTGGCYVEFVDNMDDQPYFDKNQVAYIERVSTVDEDIALLELSNPNNKTLPYININGNVIGTQSVGSTIIMYGYPSLAGNNLTRSSGELGGFDGNYLKILNTFIEHGNSGGGAYLDGSFVGIPSKGSKGEIGSLGLVISINKINSWLNNTTIAYTNKSSNDYSRVSSILKNIDPNTLKYLNISDAKVSIYSDKSKALLLPNIPGTVHNYKQPTFQIGNINKKAGIVGYYVGFGINIKADPEKNGNFIEKPEYTPQSINKDGVYYFIFKAKDGDGNISEDIITEYTYKYKKDISTSASISEIKTTGEEVKNIDSVKVVTNQNTSSAPEQQKEKISPLKRLFSWLANLFNKLATR